MSNLHRTNCPNCGAALEQGHTKCPFCGTTYLDMTAIDFSSGEPVFCEFLMDVDGGNKVLITMKAIPVLHSLNFTNEVCEITGGWGQAKVAQWTTSRNVTADISFEGVL